MKLQSDWYFVFCWISSVYRRKNLEEQKIKNIKGHAWFEPMPPALAVHYHTAELPSCSGSLMQDVVLTQDSATCPHCNGADETAEHLVLHCPAHDQARRESWPNLHNQSDPRRLWSFLEKIVAKTRPPDWEWARDSKLYLTIDNVYIIIIIIMLQSWLE